MSLEDVTSHAQQVTLAPGAWITWKATGEKWVRLPHVLMINTVLSPPGFSMGKEKCG